MKILIVDDERSITDSLVTIFSKEGYETHGVYSAELARELLFEWAPDLAIIDFCLPKMNGLDLAILVKAECPDCRLLLFDSQITTKHVSENARHEGLVFDVIAKPVHPKDLLNWAKDIREFRN
jgi:DNA-binding NtrC family response regulator